MGVGNVPDVWGERYRALILSHNFLVKSYTWNLLVGLNTLVYVLIEFSDGGGEGGQNWGEGGEMGNLLRSW